MSALKRWVGGVGLMLAACASPQEPYRTADSYELERQRVMAGSGPQIELGRPNRVIDGLNHYVLSLPAKLVLWNWQILDHELPPESRRLLENYLEVNDLRAVKVRHNQYAPIGEFRRLVGNENVSGFYRYTFGLIGWVVYTVFPGRLLAGLPLIGAGDHFNPLTNTINVYSSDPTVLLHEGGHAKDFMDNRFKGTGSFLPRLIPGVDLIQEATATSDALHYLQCSDETDLELRGYRKLYPAYSTYIGGYLGGLLFYAPTVVGGHILGNIQANARKSDIEEWKYFENMRGNADATSSCSLPSPETP